MAVIKAGVIGCGSIAKYRHIPEYAAEQQVELVAFCDVVKKRAQEVANLYGGDVYTDYRELLRKAKLDVVSVCTSNKWHSSVSKEALQAGIHVLCEKPLATTVAEAGEMIKIARGNNKILMVGHNQRLMEAHIKAKEILSRGEIGRIYSFRTVFAHGGPEDWSIEGKNGWFFRKEDAVVGALGDLGIHKIDLLRWLLDDEIIEVAAFTGILEKTFSEVEDNAVCLLKTAKGRLGTLAVSWSYRPGEDNSTLIFGERGVIKIGADPEYQVIVELTNGQVSKYKMKEMTSNEEGGQTDSGIIKVFIDTVTGSTKLELSGEEGYRSLRVILAAVESAQNKTIVSL